jgi:hypothetical protein
MDKKFVLIYSISGYAECGGGTYFGFYDSLQGMEDVINKINEEHKDPDYNFCVEFAGEIRREIEVSPIEIITKFKLNP